MKTRAVLALAAAAGLATISSAQETITFTLKFDSAQVNVGESNDIQVWAEFAPGVGATAIAFTQGFKVGTIVAFASAIFDLMVTQGSGLGAFQVKGVGKYFELGPTLGIAGKFQGDLVGSDIVGINPGQAPIPSPDPSNPILLGTASWKSTGGFGSVGMNTKVTSSPKVYLCTGLLPFPEPWAAVNLPGSFSVIPAPAGLALLALAGLSASRRRR